MGRDSQEPPGVEGIEPPDVLVGEFNRGMGASGSPQSDLLSSFFAPNSESTVVMSSHDESGVACMVGMTPSRPELLLPRPERFLRSRCRRFWNHTWIWRVETLSSAPSCLRVSTFGNWSSVNTFSSTASVTASMCHRVLPFPVVSPMHDTGFMGSVDIFSASFCEARSGL